ncbi:integrase [Acidiphilium sp.]|uniref:integrase n=1 Tax=Acidiphilium sp. TaxID=527 RepID=UPI002587B619|nr:integrase [Acidiphilium sp.]
MLASAPLRPGFTRDALSRYGDASWDLGPAVFRENARRCHLTVHFGAVPDLSVARCLREYLYARLNVDLPGIRPPLPPASLRQVFNRARRFFEFVRAELGSCDLARVDQGLLDRYAKLLRNGRCRPVIVALLLEVVFDLHAYRAHLPTAALAFEPWPGRSRSQVAGYRFVDRENQTPRIPEAVITPLLAWSLKYVTVFAPDILAARHEFCRLEERQAASAAADADLPPDERRARRRERVLAYLEGRRLQGRGMPVWTTAHNGITRRDPVTGTVTPPVNWMLLHQHAGIDVHAEPKAHLQLSTGAPDLVAAAIAAIGIETGGMDTPMAIDPATGRPWRPRFDARTLVHEERMLQAACYVVCAYLTGMRDCEVQAMRAGCLSLTRSADGVIERHCVRSVAYKGESSRGEAADWVTIEPVAEAIQVLEQLSTRASTLRGSDTLWPVLDLGRASKDHVSAEIVRQLNVYRDHLNTLFGTPDSPVVPPGPTGTPWRLTTRQFRRTIAWHIANRPFGTIAGMIQYKHASVAAFEGYAGASRSGFRAEVDAERRRGQLDDILSYFDERQAGATLFGPAAVRVGRALDAAVDELEPWQGMIADRGRLRTLLASTARTLHVGILADCFFDPATAACLRQATDPDRAAPVPALCQPTRCPNACITARHRPAWSRAAADARATLAEKRLSALQRAALVQDLRRIEAVLDGIPDT